MMRVISHGLISAALAAAALLGVRASPPEGVASLSIKGRSNATPWVAAAGSFVAVAWGASGGSNTDVFLAVSRDAGRTFGSPVQVNTMPGEARLGGELPPRVSLASRGPSAEPEIAVLWSAQGKTTEVKAARSLDGGKSFAAPTTLQASDAPGDRGWPALALDKQGTAHAIWLDHRGLAAGRSDGPTRSPHRGGMAHDGVAMAQKSGLYYAAAGQSPTAERELAKGVCYCCKTALAAGPDGSLYAAWRHVYPGNLRDMAFVVSRDGGRSFSSPVRVSEDGWAIDGCPDDGPALAIDAQSTVHIVWPTVIDDPKPEGALFYASMHNGGRFTPRIRIPTLGSPKPAHPQIAVDRGGRIVVAWDEVIKGQRVAAAREVKLRPNQPADFGSAITLATDGPAMYPVLAATDNGLVAVWATGGESSVVRARVIRVP